MPVATETNLSRSLKAIGRGWKDPYHNDEVGVAHFDNLLIRTDSLLDPRVDRVMPVWPEEQVLMGRILSELIRRSREKGGPPGLVLDIGTGCGVFALLAALEGCRVVAVDVSGRACSFVSRNANYNEIKCRKFQEDSQRLTPDRIMEEVKPGEIVAIELDILEHPASWAGVFDVVTMAPPYTPTHEELMGVAIHAQAGPLGQDIFEKQIEVVPRLLRDGGWCLGNHMGLLSLGPGVSSTELPFDQGRGQALSTVKRIKEAFGRRLGSLELVSILPTVYPIERFLHEQYADVAVELNLSQDGGEGIESRFDDWVASVKRDATHLGLAIFYVTTGRNLKEEPVEVCRLQPSSNGSGLALHRRTWHNRVEAHRHIVNATNSTTFRTTPGLFDPITNRFTPEPCVVRGDSSSESLREFFEAEGRWESTGGETGTDAGAPERRLGPLVCPSSGLVVVEEIDRFVQREGLGNLFSVIFVNGAPAHGDARERLRTQFALWIEGSLSGGQALRSGEAPARAGREFLRCFLELVEGMQLSKLAPFGHPAFIAKARSTPGNGRWPEGLATRGRIDSADDLKAKELVEKYRRRYLLPALEGMRGLRATGDRGVNVEKTIGFDAERNIAWSTLEESKVKKPGHYLEGWRERCGPETTRSERIDLRTCHWVVHQELNSMSLKIDSEFIVGESMLFGVPLGLWYRQTEEEAISQPGYPAHYKGAFWLYLIPKIGGEDEAWSELHERKAQALLRTTWFLFLASHVSQADDVLDKLGVPWVALDDLTVKQWRALYDARCLSHHFPGPCATGTGPAETDKTIFPLWLDHRLPSDDERYPSWQPRIRDVLRGSYGADRAEEIQNPFRMEATEDPAWREWQHYPAVCCLASVDSNERCPDHYFEHIKETLSRKPRRASSKDGSGPNGAAFQNIEVQIEVTKGSARGLIFNAVALSRLLDSLADSMSDELTKPREHRVGRLIEGETVPRLLCLLDYSEPGRVRITICEQGFAISDAAFESWGKSARRLGGERGGHSEVVVRMIKVLGCRRWRIFNPGCGWRTVQLISDEGRELLELTDEKATSESEAWCNGFVLDLECSTALG